MFDQDNHEREAKRRFSRRTLLVGAGQMAGLSVLGWRLFQLQVVNHGRYAPLADENRISLQTLAPKRGRILDRNGLVLADNEEHFRATLTPGLAGDVAHILSLFRRIVPLQHDELEKLVRRAKKQSRNPSILIATDLSFEQVAEINLFAPRLPGIATQTAWRRKYRQGPATGHVVGYVGNVERVGLDDDAVMRLPGMKTGKSGIEAGMEKQLRGQGGTIKIEVDAHGHAVRDLESQEPREGRDVLLTIDAALQKRILDRLMRERRASCVVLDVTSGEVVVMASVPGFDPGDVAEGISNESWQRLVNAEDKPLLNRAIAGQYPPRLDVQTGNGAGGIAKGLCRSGRTRKLPRDLRVGRSFLPVLETNGAWRRRFPPSGQGILRCLFL